MNNLDKLINKEFELIDKIIDYLNTNNIEYNIYDIYNTITTNDKQTIKKMANKHCDELNR